MCPGLGQGQGLDRGRYYAETFYAGCVWDQNWTPKSHWNAIKHSTWNGFRTWKWVHNLFFLVPAQVQREERFYIRPYNPFAPIPVLAQSQRQPVCINHNNYKVVTCYRHQIGPCIWVTSHWATHHICYQWWPNVMFVPNLMDGLHQKKLPSLWFIMKKNLDMYSNWQCDILTDNIRSRILHSVIVVLWSLSQTTTAI